MTISRLTSAVVAATALLMLAGCTAASPISTPTGASSRSPSPAADVGAVAVEQITDGLDVPWSVAFHGTVALVSERDSARIIELAADGTPRQVGVIPGATPRGEGGLLGIAVHGGYLYAYFTTAVDNRVDRYELTGQAGALGLGAAETILEGLDAAGYHNGGRIAFGPDGMLYVTVGDAGNPNAAQDVESLSGKILRLAPDGGVPDDNPFAGSPVYSYGHRNPQGIAWDEAGTLYASEFGQDTWDELNVIQPGGNYGWPEVEGISGDRRFIDPVQQWAPDQASPSGIAVAGGQILLANLRGERLRSVPLDDLTASRVRFAGEYGRLRDVVVAPDGSVWVVTSNTDGRGDPSDGDDRILRVPVD
jgi:glucose/arabinose dehydrogenase